MSATDDHLQMREADHQLSRDCDACGAVAGRSCIVLPEYAGMTIYVSDRTFTILFCMLFAVLTVVAGILSILCLLTIM
jgi:hypothetical protein